MASTSPGRRGHAGRCADARRAFARAPRGSRGTSVTCHRGTPRRAFGGHAPEGCGGRVAREAVSTRLVTACIFETQRPKTIDCRGVAILQSHRAHRAHLAHIASHPCRSRLMTKRNWIWGTVLGVTFGLGLALGVAQTAEARSPSSGASHRARNYCTTGTGGTLCCVDEASATALGLSCLGSPDPVQCVVANAARGNCEMR